MTIKAHSRYCQRVGLLLALGAVVSHASAEQQNTESFKADRRTICGSSETIAPGLVSSDQGLAIIGAALAIASDFHNAELLRGSGLWASVFAAVRRYGKTPDRKIKMEKSRRSYSGSESLHVGFRLARTGHSQNLGKDLLS
jgi:hypothetical protein